MKRYNIFRVVNGVFDQQYTYRTGENEQNAIENSAEVKVKYHHTTEDIHGGLHEVYIDDYGRFFLASEVK